MSSDATTIHHPSLEERLRVLEKAHYGHDEACKVRNQGQDAINEVFLARLNDHSERIKKIELRMAAIAGTSAAIMSAVIQGLVALFG